MGALHWLVSALLLVTLSAPAELPPGGTFVDDDGGLHEGSIEAVAAVGITVGCNPPASDRFCPDRPVTRAEMATFLTRALDLEQPLGIDTFTDDDASVHRGSIEAIAAVGITVGCNPPTGDRFCPDQSVTRAQMASFLTRALHLEQVPGANTFMDDDFSVHQGDIEAITAAGITVGCNPPAGDRFCPDRPLTRAEMATLLTRALGLEPQTPPPGFYSTIMGIDADLAERMEPSWRTGCPVPLSDLRYVLVDYWGFDGREHRGELVVHADWADEIVAVFEELFQARFPFEQMVLIDEYDGDDGRSMAANNTSAFNCRFVSGTTRWSEHAYGRAIDINPVQNPYVRGSIVSPSAGSAYVDRTLDLPGMIHSGDVVVTAFDNVGWLWGGNWINSKDYQHFSATGR
jgi:hypothetical protein